MSKEKEKKECWYIIGTTMRGGLGCSKVFLKKERAIQEKPKWEENWSNVYIIHTEIVEA